MGTRAEYIARRRAASEARKALGLDALNAPVKPGKVPMADYLAVCDERDAWRRRALDAESRLQHSGDVLGEGKFKCGKHQGGESDSSF